MADLQVVMGQILHASIDQWLWSLFRTKHKFARQFELVKKKRKRLFARRVPEGKNQFTGHLFKGMLTVLPYF